MIHPDFERLKIRLREKNRSHPQPVSAMVELTYGCNLRCVHCYNPTHEAKGEKTTTEVLKILDELAAQGCLRVGFTGGELFTRRDALEILWHAKRKGFLFNILTNATLVTPSLADQLQALDPLQVEISIYGATAGTYEKFTGVPGSFAKFVRGVDLLIERKVPVLVKIVLISLNIHELDLMWDFASRRHVRCIVSTTLQPKANGSKEPLAYRVTPEQAFEVWRRFSGEGTRRNLQLKGGPAFGEDCGSAGRLFNCACGKTSLAVSPYGKMNLCVSMQYPEIDLSKRTVGEAWNQLVEMVASTQPGASYECGECRLAALCPRGTHHGWLEQGDFSSGCIPHYRQIAEQKAAFLNEKET